MALLWLAPFYLMIVNAFKTKKGIFSDVLGFPEELTFENFKNAFIDLAVVYLFSYITVVYPVFQNH